jgi:thymidylate synthase (FAD)
MKVELVAHTPYPLCVCAEAAAVCYDSKPALNIIKGCIRSGHTSVLEHATFTFRIEGISRSCSHQIVRHRIASYSQQSQRYVQYDELDWAVDGLPADAVGPVMEASADALIAYKKMLNDGIKAENARRALPNATPTIIYVTMNIRSLMNFFNERLCARAETEIRKVAMAMRDAIFNDETQIMEDEIAILKTIFVPKCEKTNPHYCPEGKDRCGKYSTLKELLDKAYREGQLSTQEKNE